MPSWVKTVVSISHLKLHLIPFLLSISCHWIYFLSSQLLMVEKSKLQLTDLITPGWSKILWNEDDDV